MLSVPLHRSTLSTKLGQPPSGLPAPKSQRRGQGTPSSGGDLVYGSPQRAEPGEGNLADPGELPGEEREEQATSFGEAQPSTNRVRWRGDATAAYSRLVEHSLSRQCGSHSSLT